MNRSTRRKRLRQIEMTINVLEGKRRAVTMELAEVLAAEKISHTEAPTHPLTEQMYARAREISEKVVFQTQTRAKILAEPSLKHAKG